MTSHCRMALLVAFLLPVAPPLAAQLRLGLEAAHVSHSRSVTFALEPGAEGSIGPGNATRIGVGVGASLGRARLGLLVAHASGPMASGLAEVGELLTGEFGYTEWTLMPSVGWPLVTSGTGGGVRLHAGPSLDVWDITGAESRVLLSVALAAIVEAPLGRELALTARIEGSTGPSVLGDEFAQAGAERHAGRRLAIGLGVAWTPAVSPAP